MNPPTDRASAEPGRFPRWPNGAGAANTRAAHPSDPEAFFCECNDPGCMERLDLTLAEFLELRQAHPIEDGFAVVARGHEHGERVALIGRAIGGQSYAVVLGSS